MNYLNKRVLFFFPENPFAKRGGNITRAYTNLKHLKSLGLKIDLVGIEDFYKNFGDSYEDIDKNIIDDILILKRRPLKKLSSYIYWKYKIIKFFTKKNKSNFFYTKYFQDTFDDFYKDKTYDYIIINYEFWTDVIRKQNLNGAVTIIDTHDWITLNEFYKNKEMNIGRKFNEEIKNLSFYDKVITISYDEYFVFKSFLPNKVFNIPPSFSENFETEFIEKEYDLIFVGSDNPFNIHSLNWFVEKVMPLLSNINICVIGRVCNHIPDKANIKKIPFADHLDEYYHKSRIAICPMLEGTGIKIKVVEALSFGLPVVGNEKAVDGFIQKTGNGCMVTNDEKQFANIITRLCSDETLYEKQREEAVEFFKNNFSEKKSIELWKSVLE